MVKSRNNGDWWLRIGGPAGNSILQAGVTTASNEWVHIACTFDSGTAKIYINGQLENSATGVAYDVDDIVTDLQIGHVDGQAYWYTFPGLIDDVRIYDAALTDAAIESIAEVMPEPVAQWSLDDGFGGYATDSSSNGHTGVLESIYTDPEFSTTAKIGSGSLECFDGQGSRMNGGTSPGSADTMTVAFWAKADSVIYSSPVGKCPNDSTGNGWRVLFRNNGDIWYSIGSLANNYSYCRASAAYTTNTWVHVACTFESGTAKIYVDGILKDTDTGITQTINNTASDLCVGHIKEESPIYTFDGLLDEVRLYDKVLSDTEIANLASNDY